MACAPSASTFFNFLDYMKRRGPARRADGACRRSSCTRTTRSASARTGRPTSRSSSSPRCGRSRTSTCVRPADANETALAWHFALTQTETPDGARAAAARACRPGPRRRSRTTPIERGAYVLRESSKDEPDLILIGTGSEVHICAEAADLLEAGRHRHARRVHALPGHASPSRTRTTATACCRRLCARACRSRRRRPLAGARWIGDDGAGDRDDDLRRVRARNQICTSTSASRPRRSPSARAG